MMCLVHLLLALASIAFGATLPRFDRAGTGVERRAATTDACNRLSAEFPELTYLPGSNNYTYESTAFWSEESVISPTCVFTPTTDANIGAGMKIVSSTGATFGVRSGGHMPNKGFAGSSGVLIGMTNFQTLSITDAPNDLGEQYCSVQPGKTWGQIYQYVDAMGLSVTGGRVFSVGTSLILGGGISYFSGERGWASNQVLNFHGVLANGTVFDANAKQNADLWWALKGGSNNFGIITRYDTKTFPIGEVYGGSQTYTSDQVPEYLAAHAAFIAPGGGMYDPKAAIMPSIEMAMSNRQASGGITMLYNSPDPNPEALRNFTDIGASGYLGVQSFADVALSTAGFGSRANRESFYTMSMKADPEGVYLINQTIVELGVKYLDGQNVSIGAAIEPLPSSHLAAAQQAGGDPMDLSPTDGSVTIALMYARWDDPALDAAVKEWSEAATMALKEKAVERGWSYDFTFLNDAGPDQEPFSTYGSDGASKARLQAIASKYDPKGVFQTQTGGFHVTAERSGPVK